ncbi:MAG: BREX-4 system phosphatase PglZ [Exilispira sp.]|jgi:hypothetical protein|nr:BREX-4 system phosphatase PglZ [Exilispira sp.]
MNIDELIEEIEKDIKIPTPTQRRYPIRFIFFYNRENIIDFIDKIKLNNIFNIEYLSKYLEYDDQWFTYDTIYSFFSNIKKNTVILGLSEYLRFCDKTDFNILLNRLAEIETNDNFRIIVPLFGLKERFDNEFWEKFSRKNAWAPIWNIESNYERISIYILNLEIYNFNFLSNNYILIQNSKSWLNFLKEEKNKQIVSISNTLNYFFNNFLPDQNFDLKQIDNYKEFFNIFFNNNFDIEYNKDDDKIWQKLSEYIIKNNIINSNFESIVMKVFNISDIDKIDFKDIIDIYFKSKFEDILLTRWIIKHFILKNKEKFNYFFYVFSDIINYDIDSLVYLLWFKIFDIKKSIEFSKERRDILSYIIETKPKSVDITDKLQEHLEKLKEEPIENCLYYLTNFTDIEKKFIINKLNSSNNFEEDLVKISTIFTDIYYYISWENIINSKIFEESIWILNYFKEYNKCKILNIKSNIIDETIEKINRDKETLCEWYYKIKEIKPEDLKKTIWVDGLGLEWLPLLIYYLYNYHKEKNISVDFNITRAKLPSITEINKFENCYKISNLDDFIHKQNPYSFPESIIKEFSIIKEIASEIITKIEDYLFIVSDHGFTFFSQKKFREFKKCSFNESSHEGRCILDKNVESEDEYYCNWDIKGTNRKSVIALKHASLEDVPYRETHGGATPEEVIIPFIKVENLGIKNIKYKIKIKDEIIKTMNPVIEFSIYPEPKYEEVKVLIIGDNISEFIAKKEGTVYKVNFENKIGIGTKKLIISIRNYQEEFQIEIISGYKERDLI